ncbi:MAG: T9SS type A sorting domain-containing protein [Bacteroidota bacterium]
MYRSLIIFLGGICALIPLLAQGQGTLVLIGGNSEIQGGWSDIPYQWAINQSENRKVAIITYERETPWLQEYFLSLGAVDVQHFRIFSSEIANLEWMYDSLMSYDVLFFSGENQHEYLEAFQDSRVEEAIKDKFGAGGVICGSSAGMSILGNVIFTEDKGPLSPRDVLADVNHPSITLKEGLVDLYDGFLFDNHFTEKGRGGRLVGFLAHWALNQQDQIAGIGVDDKTAFCIDSYGIGRVFGTGAVTVYLSDLIPSEFDLIDTKAVVDSVRVIQLLENDSFDMVSWEAHSSAPRLIPPQIEETGQYTLLMSGSDPLSENNELLDALVYEEGKAEDEIVIVTSPENSAAGAVQAVLLTKNVPAVHLLTSTKENRDKEEIKELIEGARKFLFVGNDFDSLFAFIRAYGSNGDLLMNRIREKGMIIAFMGDDSRLAGKRFVQNYQEVWASYDGILDFQDGLGLLQTTIVMPNTHLNQDYVENTTSAVPYCMVKDSLAYGLWLGQHSYAKYYPKEGISYLQGFGQMPLMLLKNPGTNCHIAPSYGGAARNIAGFKHMYLSLIDSAAMPIGHPRQIVTADVPVIRGDWLSVYPNPVKDQMNIFLYGRQNGTFDFQLIDGQGKIHLTHKQVIGPTTQTIQIPIPNLAQGVYVLQVRTQEEGIVHSIQIIR